jgi:hypothetical protein
VGGVGAPDAKKGAGAGAPSGGGIGMGATYAPVPGATTTLEMPTIPVAAPGASPGKAGANVSGRKGNVASANQSPGLAPGMYNLGGRGSRAKSAEKKK